MTDNNSKEKTQHTAEQNAQARLVLIQLLWLFVVLIMLAMAWLYNNQQKLALHVEERLAVIKSFEGRMNDVDDRLFAMSASPQHTKNERTGQHDMQLLGVQLDVVDRLYRQGNYNDAGEMLKILQEQLSNDEMALAVPLKSSLITAIKEDLTSLTVLQKTTDPWQADMARLQEVQSYLRYLERQLPISQALTREEMLIRDGAIAISLAIGATAMRDRAMMVGYLNDSLHHLKRLEELGKNTSEPPTQKSAERKKSQNQEPSQDTSEESVAEIDNATKAIFVVNGVLANPPTLPMLKSVALIQSTKTATLQ